MKRIKINKFFLLIILLSICLRVFSLSTIPPGFYCDEACSGYTAYSILTTGKNINGDTMPIFFRYNSQEYQVGDVHGGIYAYSMVPFIAVLGLNEFSVRATSAFWGVLTIIVLFFFVKRVCNTNIALLSTFLLTISPWHLHFSRIGFRAVTYPFFLVLGLLFFYKGLKERKYLYLSAIVFALSIYTYSISRVFTPLFVLGLLIFYYKDLTQDKKYLYRSIFIFTIIILPFLYWMLFRRGEFLMRYSEVSIFATNKNIFDVLKQFIKNWLSYYSPAYLFLSGDKLLRHSVRGIGQLYFFTAPFVIYGIFLCIKKRKPFNNFLIYWLLLFPIPASLTGDSPHAIRSIVALPMFQILSAYGIYKLWLSFHHRLMKNISLLIFIIVALISGTLYLSNYFSKYPVYSAPWWQYGFKKAITYIEPIKDNYDSVYVAYWKAGGYEPQMFVLFYSKHNPEELHRAGLKYSGYKPINVRENVTYHYHHNKEKSLYLVPGFELQGIRPKKVIYYPDGRIALKIIEKK